LAKESKLTTTRKGTTKEDIIKLLARRKKIRKKKSDWANNSKKNISTTLLGQFKEKYFDYFVFNVVYSGLIRSGARRRALVQTIGNARGLDINSPLSAKNHPQDLRFRRYQQHGDPNNARGLDNNFASDRDCDSTTTTRLRHRRLRRADHAVPEKS
jgi:hypothetical protein